MQTIPSACRLAALFVFLAGGAARAEFKLTDTDRVVLFGDTAVSEISTLDLFDQFVRTRYPELKALVGNLGQPRGKVSDGLARLEREVYPLEPTEVVLCFGLEGTARQAFDQAQLDAHIAELTKMIEALRAKKIRVSMLTPPPSDDAQSRGLKAVDHRGTMGKYSEAIRALGKQAEVPVIDWNAAVEEHIQKFSSKKFPGWTRQGMIPSWYSLAILADVLLTHWGAEPLEYLITVDWTAPSAKASLGTVRVAESTPTHLLLALEGVPVVVNVFGGQNMEPADWPLSRWFSYRLQLSNPPERSLVISAAGANGQTYMDQQLAAGADMSTSGPLINQPVVLKLHDAILRKSNQFTQYRIASERTPPEPELEEAYELLQQGEAALVIAAHKIAYRLPARFDVSLRIEASSVASAPAAENSAIGTSGEAAPQRQPRKPK